MGKMAVRCKFLPVLLGAGMALWAQGMILPAAAQDDSAQGEAVGVSPSLGPVSPSSLGASVHTPNLNGTPSSAEALREGTSGKTRLNRNQAQQINARGAVENGEAQPLGMLLKKLRKAVPGDVVNVQLRRSAAGWTYDVTVLNNSGRYVRVSINARTGAIISKVRR